MVLLQNLDSIYVKPNASSYCQFFSFSDFVLKVIFIYIPFSLKSVRKDQTLQCSLVSMHGSFPAPTPGSQRKHHEPGLLRFVGVVE